MSKLIAGWQCPVCKNIYSPYMNQCPVCNINRQLKTPDTSGCSCRKENGGSGVCGCILGGIQITS